MDFPDGYKAKNLESGKCAICSNCETIKAKFGDELDLPKNKKLNDDLKKIEAELKAKPGDPDLIAKQKAMHDKLYKDKLERLKTKKEGLDPNSPKAQEIEAEINTTKSERVDNTLDIYDQKVNSGQYSRTGKTDADIEKIKTDVQTELDGGRVMNPESGKFHSGDKGPVVKANKSKTEFEFGGQKSVEGHGGVHEVNVSHSDLSPEAQAKLKQLEADRTVATNKKRQIEQEYADGNGTHARFEDDPRWKDAHKDQLKASEGLGDVSTKSIVESHLEGAEPLSIKRKDKNVDAKSGEFDSIYEHNGEIYIFESKGAGADLGTRNIDGVNYQQGSAIYREDMIAHMRAEALGPPPDIDLLKTVRKLEEAGDNVKYMQVSQRLDDNGNMVPSVKVNEFNQKAIE